MAFSKADLLASLKALPVPSRYLLAYSGGLDSSVLLHALGSLGNALAAPLQAIHIDHGLQAGSDSWGELCQRCCDQLGVPLIRLALNLSVPAGESVEACARDGRYSALADVMQQDDMLLTAHHRDDQAETLLLQLLRGAGVDGLAAMPLLKPWQSGWQARPLLDVSRAELHQYALDRGLEWIEDPSNSAIDFDRNYLRHHLTPVLQQRWPSFTQTLARSARHCASASQLLVHLAEGDFENCRGNSAAVLDAAGLMALSTGRAANLLRYWLRQQGCRLPDERKLNAIIQQVANAREDASPLVVWGRFSVRRYRGELYVLPRHLPACPERELPWHGDVLQLPQQLGELRRHLAQGGIDRNCWDRAEVSVRWRHLGLRCQPAGREGTRSFKKIAQDLAIPPWLRDLVPLIFIDGELAAIGDYLVCESFAAKQAEEGWNLRWFSTPGLR